MSGDSIGKRLIIRANPRVHINATNHTCEAPTFLAVPPDMNAIMPPLTTSTAKRSEGEINVSLGAMFGDHVSQRRGILFGSEAIVLYEVLE